jgi:hypothetical protein
MLTKPSLSSHSKRREWLCRLDRIAADLNILLLMFAIGLATLDLTFIIAEQVIDRLPQVTRVGYVNEPAQSPHSTASQSISR